MSSDQAQVEPKEFFRAAHSVEALGLYASKQADDQHVRGESSDRPEARASPGDARDGESRRLALLLWDVWPSPTHHHSTHIIVELVPTPNPTAKTTPARLPAEHVGSAAEHGDGRVLHFPAREARP